MSSLCLVPASPQTSTSQKGELTPIYPLVSRRSEQQDSTRYEQYCAQVSSKGLMQDDSALKMQLESRPAIL